MNQKNKLKIAMISGASYALKYKKKNPSISDEEILQQINRESDDILDKIDSSY
jgi:hypothetical protein